jgi:hypothetical protein
MIESKKYENYPRWIVILANALALSIYGLGCLIILHLGWISLLLYLLYILALEYRLIGKHCVNCFYWGKTCGFGKGKVSSWFFKKSDAAKFWRKEMTWKDMIPDLLVALIPFITGIVLIIAKFDYILLGMLICLFLLTTQGNEFVRGKLTCRYCKQRALGCPADKLFNNK